MTVANRLLIHVLVGAALIIAVVAGLTYHFVYQAAEQRTIESLNSYVAERTRREEAGFQTIYSNLEVVRGQFLKRDNQPIFPDVQERWDRRFMLYPDGAWRSREEFYSPRVYSNLWLHKDFPLTPQFQTRVLRAQEICEDVQPGWIDSFQSVYFILPGPATMGFDPRIPRWSWQTPGDYDLAAEEWVKEASPERNPSRGFVWTGVFVDPPTKEPFVTVQLPVERDGVQLATVAHDMHINQLFNEITRSDFEGATHLIFRPDGRLIAHPTLREQILASNGALTCEGSGDASLASLYRIAVAHAERKFSGIEPVSRSYFSASRLPAAEWYFVTLMPRSFVQKQAFGSAQWVWFSGLASLGLLFVSFAGILRRQVTRPLAELTRVTEAMRAGVNEVPLTGSRADELGALATSFKELSAKVAARETDLRQLNLELEQRVADRTAELARFGTILDLTPDFVGICDMQQRVVYVNRTGRQLANLPAEGSLEQVHVADFHPPWAYRVIDEEALPMALREGSWTGEVALHDHTGREFPVSMACIIIRAADGTPQFAATIMRDLSERQRVQHELERALQHERELGEMKSNFVSLVSHEFRTPLGVIMSAVEVLQRYFERLPAEKRALHLEMIFRSTRNLANLIEEVLLLGRVEEGRMQFAPVPLDLEKLCRTLCDELHSATGAACPIRFQALTLLDGVISDESVLRHILSNLLSNACKYSEPGMPVDFAAERRGDDVVFTIRDRGIGIPPEDQARLFTSFTRASNVGTRPGTGLGLVVVKRCVALHGGTLELTSQPGQGTTVTVTLPVFHNPQSTTRNPQ